METQRSKEACPRICGYLNIEMVFFKCPVNVIVNTRKRKLDGSLAFSFPVRIISKVLFDSNCEALWNYDSLWEPLQSWMSPRMWLSDCIAMGW